MTLGKLYGVSLGPGDPELITRRGWAQLQRRDTIWAYPVRSKKRESYALGIVERSGVAMPEESHPLHFPMTHDAERLTKHWHAAAVKTLTLLRTGRDVLFLVEGDASTYATFGYLAQYVAAIGNATDTGIDIDAANSSEPPEIEIIPGVPSFVASCAKLQVPLSEQDDTIAIVPAAYGVNMLKGLFSDFDTLVLMKVKPLLDELIDLLEQRGILHHCTFIEKAGAPEERVVRDLRTLRGETVNYLSLLIVKNPSRVRGERIKGCKKKMLPADETKTSTM